MYIFGFIGGLGAGELLIILAIVFLVFGASRLPQLGDGVGKFIRNLKRGLNENEKIEVTPQEKRVEAKTDEAKTAKEQVEDAEIVEK